MGNTFDFFINILGLCLFAWVIIMSLKDIMQKNKISIKLIRVLAIAISVYYIIDIFKRII